MSTRIRVPWAAIALLTWLTPMARAVDDAAVQKAVVRGVDYLKRSQTPAGLWTRQANGTSGATALAGLALLESEVSADDPAIQKAAEALREGSIPLTDTYSISLCILFFDRLAEAGDVPLIESLTVRLLAGQTGDGGWTYECPALGEAEVARLKNLLRDRHANNQKPRTAGKNRSFQDLPLQIQQQLLVAERLRPGQATAMISDNSNTQFATLALWVGHRHGLPVSRSLARLEKRFRNTQNADGGWDYTGGPSMNTRPAMTCAGLLGLAVADGIANETLLANAKESKESAPRTAKPRPLRDPARDRSVRVGLLALGSLIAQPVGLRQLRTGPFVLGNAAPRSSLANYYFLWSLERVAVVFGLQTIGNQDWYSWGAEFILAQQQSDGSWRSDYPEGGVDTSFALLFLRRSNLAQDLTNSLRGKVEDPGQIALKAGGVGGELAKKNTPSVPEPGDRGSGKSLLPKLLLPTVRAAEKPTLDPEAARLSAELVQAPPAQREVLLDKLKDSKGILHTQALASAIPQLTGPSKTKARDALAERIARMTASTLVDKLQDPDVEIRRAAALACAMKEEKRLIPNLIQLLDDSERIVVRAAHAALKTLTGQDFGPEHDASGAERATAVAAWKSWWTKQAGSVSAADSASATDVLRDKEKLQGAWVLISLERQGKSVPKAQLGSLRIKLLFSGDSVTFAYPDHIEIATYKLDVGNDLKTIDVITDFDTSKGVYQLQGDSLKICGVPAGEERPTELATKPGTKQVLFVLERQRP